MGPGHRNGRHGRQACAIQHVPRMRSPKIGVALRVTGAVPPFGPTVWVIPFFMITDHVRLCRGKQSWAELSEDLLTDSEPGRGGSDVWCGVQPKSGRAERLAIFSLGSLLTT